jgi:hypothetical protein
MLIKRWNCAAHLLIDMLTDNYGVLADSCARGGCLFGASAFGAAVSL